MEKLAALMKTSKDEMYEIMLGRYGTALRDEDDKLVVVTSKSELKSSKELHIDFIDNKYINSSYVNVYKIIKGSSEYDSKEMSIFIDGIVSECKEQGIEIKPQEELDSIKREWSK
jgi:hypothetical protein